MIRSPNDDNGTPSLASAKSSNRNSSNADGLDDAHVSILIINNLLSFHHIKISWQFL